MVKSCIPFLLAALSFTAFCQENSTTETPSADNSSGNKKHELNIGFTNLLNNRNSFWEDIFYMEYYDNYIYGDLYYTPFFFEGMGINSTRYGIGYKYHTAKGAFRTYADFGVNRNNYKDNSKNNSASYPSTVDYDYKWNSKLLTTRIGYEGLIRSKRTDFYFGSDLIYQYSDWSYDYTRTTTNTYTYPPYTSVSTSKSKTKANYNAIGLGPVLGLRFHLTDMISVSTETRVDILGYRQRGSATGSSMSNNSYSTDTDSFSSSGIRTKVSPLGLIALNVHL